MQGLTTFAYAVGQIFATLLPTLCYLAALSLFLFAGWGFWRQSQPDNPFRGKPWIPITGLLFCGVFASFPRFLTMANRSAGSSITLGVAALIATHNMELAGHMDRVFALKDGHLEERPAESQAY